MSGAWSLDTWLPVTDRIPGAGWVSERRERHLELLDGYQDARAALSRLQEGFVAENDAYDAALVAARAAVMRGEEPVAPPEPTPMWRRRAAVEPFADAVDRAEEALAGFVMLTAREVRDRRLELREAVRTVPEEAWAQAQVLRELLRTGGWDDMAVTKIASGAPGARRAARARQERRARELAEAVA